MLAALCILCAGCVELITIGHGIIAAGKSVEHLMGYHQPTPTASQALRK